MMQVHNAGPLPQRGLMKMLNNLHRIEQGMGAPPIFTHRPLPDSGVAVARWGRSDTGEVMPYTAKCLLFAPGER